MINFLKSLRSYLGLVKLFNFTIVIIINKLRTHKCINDTFNILVGLMRSLMYKLKFDNIFYNNHVYCNIC